MCLDGRGGYASQSLRQVFLIMHNAEQKNISTQPGAEKRKFLPVILSGGAGTRLWPVSTPQNPKPFMMMPDGKTLLEKTYERALGLPDAENILTITNADFLQKTKTIFGASGEEKNNEYILEPEGRNTAAAIGMAALHASLRHGPETIVLVMPADHIIEDHNEFYKSVEIGKILAGQGRIVTFGISPTYPETGFGYIEASGNDVLRFVEKPERSVAEKYIEAGNFYWNAGIFCFRTDVILDELKTHAPEIMEGILACYKISNDFQKVRENTFLNAGLYAGVPSLSIDYAVMEKTDKISIVPCNIGWKDIGSWNAIHSMANENAEGNRVIGKAFFEEARNCFVYSKERTVAISGVDDVIVIDAPSAVLVTKKDHAQKVGMITKKIQTTEYKPCVSRLEIDPGREYRGNTSVLWVVVEGGCMIKSQGQDIRLEKGGHSFLHAPFTVTNDPGQKLIAIEIKSGF